MHLPSATKRGVVVKGGAVVLVFLWEPAGRQAAAAASGGGFKVVACLMRVAEGEGRGKSPMRRSQRGIVFAYAHACVIDAGGV